MAGQRRLKINGAGSLRRATAARFYLRTAMFGLIVVACAEGVATFRDPTGSGPPVVAAPTVNGFVSASAPSAARPTSTPPAPAISLTISSRSDGSGSSAIALVRATASPGATCLISVAMADGSISERGLGPQSADAGGAVTWSWTVSAPGQWAVEVACGGPSANARFSVR